MKLTDSQIPAEEVSVLALSLHGRQVGYLAGYQHGRNVFTFSDAYRHDPSRPTFSLITHPAFPNAARVMAEPWVKQQRLHPVLSNLLPEGALRELIAQQLKAHPDNEFGIFSALGQDLPGAIIATPVAPENVPPQLLGARSNASVIRPFDGKPPAKFSLAGVQMKFSMKEKDGRFNLGQEDELGDWIIKTPSTLHRHVPENEFTGMTLAASAGIDIPSIKLVALDRLNNLPPLNLPGENWAFAIKRFDRDDGQRIHMEDFAQILVKYPHQKYDSASYEQVARVLSGFSGDGLADAQQFARRLLVNILLANGDAHLKNWSLIYRDRITPRLSPAYDILTTRVYIEGESRFALNLGKTKEWYAVTLDHFEAWATRAGVPWRAIKPHLLDTMDRARTLWPAALKDLPMEQAHKDQLREHWKGLHKDFRIL